MSRRPAFFALIIFLAAVLGLRLNTGISAAPAAPIAGEARIHPVESNVAIKPWASATASSATAAARAAIDGQPATAWVPAGGPGEWIAVDLGGTFANLRKVEVVFEDAAPRRYRIDLSPDGERWTPLVEDGRSAGRGAMHLFTRPGTRAVRLTLLDVPAGSGGVGELRVFNYLRDDLVLGADLSFVDDLREREFWVHPEPGARAGSAGPHLLDVVKDRGMSFVRLRVFNEPRNERTGELRTPASQGKCVASRPIDDSSRLIASDPCDWARGSPSRIANSRRSATRSIAF